MARMRRYATGAERQAAYRSRQKEALLPPLYLPALAALSTVPSTGRWRVALDLAARLLTNIAEEMQAYSDDRSEAWHEGSNAEAFHDNLERVTDAQQQLDDLRSQF